MPRCDATGWRGKFGHASLEGMEETPVLSALEGGVLTLTLNRPQRLNAMCPQLIETMNAELKRARDDDAVRAVLLTGTGRGFCAGADLAGSGPGVVGPDGKPDLGVAMDRLFNPMIRAIRALPKPVVAESRIAAIERWARQHARPGEIRSTPAPQPITPPPTSPGWWAGLAKGVRGFILDVWGGGLAAKLSVPRVNPRGPCGQGAKGFF